MLVWLLIIFGKHFVSICHVKLKLSGFHLDADVCQMAAQQSVKQENSSKKSKTSKLKSSEDRIFEGSTSSGKKSVSKSRSRTQNYENNTVRDNNLSPEVLSKKKGYCKSERHNDSIILQSDDVVENLEINTLNGVLNKNVIVKECVSTPTETNSSGSEKLSKSKKRRLRKRKVKQASASVGLSESVLNSESTINADFSEEGRKKIDIAEITETSLKNIDDPISKRTNQKVKDHVHYNVPFEKCNKKSLNENISVPNNFPEDPSGLVLTSVHSNESKPKIEEQKISAHMFNDILLNIMQTLNTNDDIFPKTSVPNESHLEIDKQGDLKAKKPNLQSDLNLIDKIKEFSDSFSKLESVEKLFNNSSTGEISGDSIGGSSSDNKVETKDLVLPLQVDDSSDILQVNDKNSAVAENNSCVKIDTCDTVSVETRNMDANSDAGTLLSKSTKSREEIKAERAANKAAKMAAKKAKSSGVKIGPERVADVVDGCVIPKKPLIHSDAIDCEKKFIDSAVTSSAKEKEELKQPTQKSEIQNQDSLGKTKAELRAERRQKQEAQRAAKAVQKDAANEKPKKSLLLIKKVIEVIPKEAEDKQVHETKESTLKAKNKVKLFSHLYFEKRLFEDYNCCNVHPSILQLGAQYEARVILGSNARCLALLHTLKKVISDYSTPSKQEFSRGLESTLVKAMNFLNYCRPISVSMTNAIRHIKWHLTQLPNSIPDSEARQKLYDVIGTYVREQIEVAGQAICNTVKKKINNGDVILTYGCSSLVYRILLESHRSGTKFSVVVVDDGHWFEGKEMLRRLVREGLECTYTHLLTATFTIREASKVLLGAHALLTNGYVMSRAGTSIVALIAHSYNVPVLVCCETHKFCERAQTDAFVYNELGDPDEFLSKTSGPVVRSNSYFKPLSIAFDVTPSDLVTAVVTELGILPCTSVPVILRMKPSEIV